MSGAPTQLLPRKVAATELDASKFLNGLWDHADVGAEVRPKLINYCLATLSVGSAERTRPVPGTIGPSLLVCLTDQSSR